MWTRIVSAWHKPMMSRTGIDELWMVVPIIIAVTLPVLLWCLADAWRRRKRPMSHGEQP